MRKLYIEWDKLVEFAKEQDIALLLEKLLLSYDIVIVKEDREIPIFSFEELYDIVEKLYEEVET
jgi:hypothetical protein